MIMMVRILAALVVLLLIGLATRALFKRSQVRALRKRLLTLCRDDTGRAVRLVQLELDRTPGLGGAEAYQRAIRRLERDMRG